MTMALYHEVVQDARGNVINGAQVTVTLSSTGALAQIYNKNVVPLPNPFLSGYDRGAGEIDFMAEDGLYDIQVASNTTTVLKSIMLTTAKRTLTRLDDGADLDTIQDDGLYDVMNPANAPVNINGQWWYVEVMRHSGFVAGSNEYLAQKVTAMNDAGSNVGKKYTRVKNQGGGWTPWSEMATIDMIAPQLHVQDRKASGVNGGSSVVGLNVRTLNTVLVNSIPGASLADNKITLPPGTYYVEAHACNYRGEANQLRLFNETTSSYLSKVDGLSVSSATTSASIASLSGRFTLTAVSLVSLHHFIQSARSADGLGVDASNAGAVDHNTYADVKIWRLA